MTKEEAKKIAVSFFYWWFNRQGQNTEQGFDDWWDKEYLGDDWWDKEYLGDDSEEHF